MARLRKKRPPKGPIVERVLQDGTIIRGQIVDDGQTKEPAGEASQKTAPTVDAGRVRGRVVKRRLPDGTFINGRIVSKK